MTHSRKYPYRSPLERWAADSITRWTLVAIGLVTLLGLAGGVAP